MKRRNLRFGFVASILFFILSSGVALAGKSAVTIEAPSEVTKGTEAAIKLHVTHSANNFFHHTNWVKVQANGKEIARWEYSGSKLPEGENFTKEIKVLVNDDMEIVAEANCNIHGSAGPAKKRISVK